MNGLMSSDSLANGRTAKTKKSPASRKRPPPYKVHIEDSQQDLPLSQRSVRKLVGFFLKKYSPLAQEVGIHFVTKRKMCALHKKFFGDPSPTDTISFPIDQEVLGDVFVCPHTALAYTAKEGGDPYLETSLYVVHGLLHLLGYDDLAPKERKKMRAEEARALHLLQERDALLKK